MQRQTVGQVMDLDLEKYAALARKNIRENNDELSKLWRQGQLSEEEVRQVLRLQMYLRLGLPIQAGDGSVISRT